jgi:hypothetical protein
MSGVATFQRYVIDLTRILLGIYQLLSQEEQWRDQCVRFDNLFSCLLQLEMKLSGQFVRH